MAGHVSRGGDGDVARLSVKSAGAAIILGATVVALDRKETGDVAAGSDGDVAAGISAYSTQDWGDLVVRRSLLPEYKATEVTAAIHIAKLGGDTDVAAVEGPDAVVPHIPRAERISGAGIDDQLVGRPKIDIAV